MKNEEMDNFDKFALNLGMAKKGLLEASIRCIESLIKEPLTKDEIKICKEIANSIKGKKTIDGSNLSSRMLVAVRIMQVEEVQNLSPAEDLNEVIEGVLKMYRHVLKKKENYILKKAKIPL